MTNADAARLEGRLNRVYGMVVGGDATCQVWHRVRGSQGDPGPAEGAPPVPRSGYVPGYTSIASISARRSGFGPRAHGKTVVGCGLLRSWLPGCQRVGDCYDLTTVVRRLAQTLAANTLRKLGSMAASNRSHGAPTWLPFVAVLLMCGCAAPAPVQPLPPSPMMATFDVHEAAHVHVAGPNSIRGQAFFDNKVEASLPARETVWLVPDTAYARERIRKAYGDQALEVAAQRIVGIVLENPDPAACEDHQRWVRLPERR